MATCSFQDNLKSETVDVVGLTEEATNVPESSTDWQATKATVRDRTAFLFNNSLMSDIKFVLAHSDGTQVWVPAHKLVLAISSPVFEAMFYGELAETREEIALPDTEPSYLLEFLRFLYCDEVRLTTDNVFSVLYLAQKYIVPSLTNECWEFIDNNTCACLESDKAVYTLNHDMLTSLAERDTLKMKKEVELFEAMKRWAEGRCKAQGLEPSGEEMRRALGDVGELIRWPTISLLDFALHVVPTGILTDKEVLDIYGYYSGPTSGKTFCEIYRAGAISDAVLHECCRQGQIRGHYFGEPANEINESVEMMVNPINVHLKGLQLVISQSIGQDAKCTVEVRLLDQDGGKVAELTGSFTSKNMRQVTINKTTAYGIPVSFKNPVLLWKATKYTLHVKFQSMPEVESPRIVFEDSATAHYVTFEFTGRSRVIYKLQFYILD